jgi:hypothetical protein
MDQPDIECAIDAADSVANAPGIGKDIREDAARFLLGMAKKLTMLTLHVSHEKDRL